MSIVIESFEKELQQWSGSPDLVEGILNAFPVLNVKSPFENMDLLAFYLYPGNSVFTAWILKSNSIVLHERNLEGLTLTISFPLSKIRRVTEQNDRNGLTVSIELDADRSSFEGVALQSEEGALAISGNMLHAGYTLRAPLQDAAASSKLAFFSKMLRFSI